MQSEPSQAPVPSRATNRHLKTHPCILCTQRKVKCDRNSPCFNCQKAKVACVEAIPIPPRKRKKRFPEAELLARIRRYEDVLKKLGVDIDAINSGAPNQKPRDGSDSPDRERSQSAKPEPTEHYQRCDEEHENMPDTSHTGQSEEFRDAEALLRGSSEDEVGEGPIVNSFDRFFMTDGSDLFYGTGPSDASLFALHPQPVHIFRLWQAFLDNVNPLVKIIHAPTVQHRILEATADLHAVPKNVEALMFSIYYSAVTSLREDECQNLFGAEKTDLLTQYRNGARQSLVNCHFMKTSDFMVLQALTLYLTPALHIMDPRTLASLIAVAGHIAQLMGLGHDGAGHGISPFDVEMRRRLWWHLALLDHRISELTGATNSLLTQSWTTKMPSNVNDSDLYPDMKELPTEGQGVTEMMFVLLRCEISQLFRKPKTNSTNKTAMINELHDHIENKYLKYCDTQIPFHLISTLVARSGVNKMRLMMQYPRIFPARGHTLLPAQRDELFTSAVRMLQYHNTLVMNGSTQHYIWYTKKHFPFVAHLFLITDLRHRTTDALATEAWDAIMASNERMRQFPPAMLESPLHTALSNLTLKAWEAHETALQKVNNSVTVPALITFLRARYPLRRSRPSTSGTPAFLPSPASSGGDDVFPLPQQIMRPQGGAPLGVGTGMNSMLSPAADLNMDIGMGMEMNNLDMASMDWDFWSNLMAGGNGMDGSGGYQNFDVHPQNWG